MATNQSPVIELLVGGPAVEVHVACFTGPNSDIPDSTAALALPNPTGLPFVTASLAAGKPRSVILTPAATGNGGGPSPVFVSEVGGVNNGLNLNVHVAVPPNIKSVVFVDVGDVQ